VSTLRRALGPTGPMLVNRHRGYQLQVGPHELDMLRFRALLEAAAAARAGGALDRAAALLREALALWRGEPFEGVTLSPTDEPERVRLAEQRVAATEELLDARLALGEHQDLVPELRALVSAYPLRERLREQLLLALYRAGRQAEALAAYVETRDTLIEQLGVEPHARLRRLHQAILRDDPAIAAPAPVPAATMAVPLPEWAALPVGGPAAAAPAGAGRRRSGRPSSALLRKRTWRWWHSLWMLPCILGVGILTWVSFLYIGVRARRTRWLRHAAVYGAAAVTAVVVSNKGPELAKHGAGLLAVITWIAGMIHASWINREWLHWRSEHPPWYVSLSPPSDQVDHRDGQ
jgi:Bacterial transcriptional activator domain